jgi:signal peptidase II
MISKKARSILMNVYFLLTGVVVLVVDQITKYLISIRVAEGSTIEVIPRFLYFMNIKNTGAAFGMFQSYTKILTIVSLVAIFLIIILKVMLNLEYVFYNISLGFILGGALGNLVDRYFIGEVTDWISFSFFGPIFNIADSFIVIGFILIIILILREYLKQGKTKGS